MDAATADKFLLHLHEAFARDDCLMAVFDVVLRNKSVVLDSLFRKEVDGVGLLTS